MKDIRYKEDISIILKNKIEKSDLDDVIKEFLLDLTRLELEHAYEKSSWYGHTKEYEEKVKVYASRLGSIQEVEE